MDLHEIKVVLTTFDGRISRSTFWLRGVLPLAVILITIGALDTALTGGVLAVIANILSIFPSTAIGVKRFHDRDKSGWWVLITLIPVIGALWYLVECGFLEGTDGDNKYGPNPLS